MPTMSPIVPVLLKPFRDRHPAAPVDVQFGGMETLKVGLNNFSLDVVITYLDEADRKSKSALPIYVEQLGLLVPDTPRFHNMTQITWKDAAALPMSMLRPSMHLRHFADEVFTAVGCMPNAHVESESILHLMFHVQYTELCTIIPTYFKNTPGLHKGTKLLDLVEPTVIHDVGMLWTEGDVMMPMASAFVKVVRDLMKSTDLQKRLSPDLLVEPLEA